MTDRLGDHVERNYQAFVELLPTLLMTRAGKFALMRDCKIIEFFDTARDAFVTGSILFMDELFSIQEVTEAPAGVWRGTPDELQSLRQPQGPRSGINAIIGRWPGDESDEEAARALEELS
jgi:hypothetical protein